MDEKKINRRDLLKGTVATAALLGASGCGNFNIMQTRPLGAMGRRISSNERLNIAAVGVGGKGKHDVSSVAHEALVAFCDVDDERAAKTYDKYPNVPRFRDYRVMFDKKGREIDAVTVSTPDHMHYPIAKHAILMGKHVFVQKPLTHTIWEARDLAELARKQGVVTQMGNQGHGEEGLRLVYEWVRSGMIGDVREVHFCTNRPIWPQGIAERPEAQSVPSTLDWNLWLGVAPERDYNEAYAPFAWRGWWDFGCGALGDMACHVMDAAFHALDLGSPSTVSARSSEVFQETAPNKSAVHYEFPERKVDCYQNGAWVRRKMPPVSVYWYDGGVRPPRPPELEEDREIKEDSFQLIIGEKATIKAGEYGGSPRIIPEAEMRDIGKPPKLMERLPEGGHYQEWITACKGGPTPGSNFDYAGPFTEMVLLGNLAIRTGKHLEWDGKNLQVTNHPEANKYITKEYREF